MRPRIEVKCIAGDNFEPAGIVRGDFLQCADRASVALDGNDSRRTKRQKRACKPARPWTDLDDRDRLERSRRASDPRGEIEIEEEVLAERFSRGKTIAANNVAQRRQLIQRLLHGAMFDTAALAVEPGDPASRAASRSAAIRLVGSAAPVPAISKAVP